MVLLLAAVIGAVGLSIARSKSPTTAKAGSHEVLLAGAAVVGVGPFAPVAAVGPRPLRASPAVLDTFPKRVVRADQEGLYDGVRGHTSCNVAAMVAALIRDPVAGQAWADAQNIGFSDAPAWIVHLTPALLRVDTYATLYTYDGRPVAHDAVLQAGTAVLLDSTGIPRARCVGSNPVTGAIPYRLKATYTGKRWSGFAPSKVFNVTVAPQPLTKFVMSDLLTNKSFVRPVETAGSKDGDAPASGGTPAKAPAAAAPAPPKRP